MSRTHKNRKTRRIRRVFLTIRTVLLILLITIVLLLVGGRIMDEYLGTHIMEDFLRTIPVQEWLKLPEEVVETSQTPAVSDSLTPRPAPAVTAAPTAAATPDTPEGEAAEFASGYTFRETKSTQNIRDDLFPDKYAFGSKYAIVVDLDHNEVLGRKDADVRMNPASMTKILTVLVAAERVDLGRLDTDTFPVDADLAVYSYVNDFSSVGWVEGDAPTIRDLFYGCILPSGADAAVGLAEYTAGSQEAFVKLMNDKCNELGIGKTTHFTNCVGLFDKDHYSTCHDMAVIMKAALENTFCREVLSAHTYTTKPMKESPEGAILSNWFLRRIEDKDTHGTVRCAKTGFVKEAGCCAASYQISDSGEHTLVVTGDTYSVWKCIYDHVALYALYDK